jgi:hypothetical protein
LQKRGHRVRRETRSDGGSTDVGVVRGELIVDDGVEDGATESTAYRSGAEGKAGCSGLERTWSVDGKSTKKDEYSQGIDEEP